MNTLFLLGSVLAVAGLLVATVFLLVTGARRRAVVAALAALTWCAAYALVLAVSGLMSRGEVLRAGETKYFCGFFLDCHIGVAVEGTRLQADGRRLVTLRFTTSALRARLSPYDVRVAAIGAGGRRYEARPEGGAQLERAIWPGESYTVDVVFDLPAGERADRLLVSEGVGLGRVLDGLVIGNDNSFLHRRTYLAI